MDEWAREAGVTCVVCPDCAFTFDENHTDVPDDGYTCPLCGELKLQAALDEARTERDKALVLADEQAQWVEEERAQSNEAYRLRDEARTENRRLRDALADLKQKGWAVLLGMVLEAPEQFNLAVEELRAALASPDGEDETQ